MSITEVESDKLENHVKKMYPLLNDKLSYVPAYKFIHLYYSCIVEEERSTETEYYLIDNSPQNIFDFPYGKCLISKKDCYEKYSDYAEEINRRYDESINEYKKCIEILQKFNPPNTNKKQVWFYPMNCCFYKEEPVVVCDSRDAKNLNYPTWKLTSYKRNNIEQFVDVSHTPLFYFSHDPYIVKQYAIESRENLIELVQKLKFKPSQIEYYKKIEETL